jgi:hypothetical protein
MTLTQGSNTGLLLVRQKPNETGHKKNIVSTAHIQLLAGSWTTLLLAHADHFTVTQTDEII